MAIDWSRKFKGEYDTAKAVIAQSSHFARDWQPLVGELGNLMSPTGFDAANESALGKLRERITKGPSQTRITEDQGLLEAAGASIEAKGGTLTAEAKRRAISLKLLRHVYLQNKAGDHKVWLVSLPKSITDWPSACMASKGTTVDAAKAILVSSDEHFTDQQKRYLGNTVQQGMAWCQRAGIVLAQAAATGGGQATADARALVRRWFADPALADATLDTYIAELADGFKKIVATLNKGNLLLTDWVPFRGTTKVDESQFLASEAFTFRNNREGMDVVYIESNFFVDNPGNVLLGQANWTRIVVHELSHLACGRIDVVNGAKRYAHYGIGPHAGYPGSDCIQNADNWAFFAADCGGALTDAQRQHALKIK